MYKINFNIYVYKKIFSRLNIHIILCFKKMLTSNTGTILKYYCCLYYWTVVLNRESQIVVKILLFD